MCTNAHANTTTHGPVDDQILFLPHPDYSEGSPFWREALGRFFVLMYIYSSHRNGDKAPTSSVVSETQDLLNMSYFRLVF